MIIGMSTQSAARKNVSKNVYAISQMTNHSMCLDGKIKITLTIIMNAIVYLSEIARRKRFHLHHPFLLVETVLSHVKMSKPYRLLLLI